MEGSSPNSLSLDERIAKLEAEITELRRIGEEAKFRARIFRQLAIHAELSMGTVIMEQEQMAKMLFLYSQMPAQLKQERLLDDELIQLFTSVVQNISSRICCKLNEIISDARMMENYAEWFTRIPGVTKEGLTVMEKALETIVTELSPTMTDKAVLHENMKRIIEYLREAQKSGNDKDEEDQTQDLYASISVQTIISELYSDEAITQQLLECLVSFPRLQ